MAYLADKYGPMRTICGVSEADETVGRVPYVTDDRELLVKLAAVTGTVILDVDLLELDVAAIVDAIEGRIRVPAPQAIGTLQEADTWVEAFTIPANCEYALVIFDNQAFCMAGMTTVAPAQNGMPYMPNLNLKVPCGKNAAGVDYNRLFVRNQTGGGTKDVTPQCTFYLYA